MKAIDAWVNPFCADFEPPFSPKAVERMMARAPQVMENTMTAPDIPSLLAVMDASGVEKAVLTDPYGSDLFKVEVEKGIEAAPDRFAGCAAIHPTTAANDKRVVRELKAKGYKAIKFLSVFSEMAYDDPRYFPIYAACEEEEMIATFTVGLPYIPISNQPQNPLTLEPALQHFPDLNFVMCHGGVPWAETCVALMRKWENLYWMSSALDQGALPAAIVEFALAGGSDRLMYATDFPAHSFQQSLSDSLLLQDEIPAHVREEFAYGVANRLFFS
ncbi:MAG: amidohydrolase family protein [Alphaproteobacteria bacterium]